MIGLNTTVLVRYIMQDDVAQSAKATNVIEALSIDTPGFIPLVTIVELLWVLGACYNIKQPQLVSVLKALLQTKEFRVENADATWQALRKYRGTKADFADCLIDAVQQEQAVRQEQAALQEQEQAALQEQEQAENTR